MAVDYRPITPGVAETMDDLGLPEDATPAAVTVWQGMIRHRGTGRALRAALAWAKGDMPTLVTQEGEEPRWSMSMGSSNPELIDALAPITGVTRFEDYL